jgi:hypothetical protein
MHLQGCLEFGCPLGGKSVAPYRCRILYLLFYWGVTLSCGFQELDIHCMESSCCDSQIGGGVQPKSVNDDQKKGAIPTEGAEPVKRSGPKLVIRIDLERAGNGRRRGKRVQHP